MIDDLTLLCSSLFVFAMEMCVGERKRAIEKEVRKCVIWTKLKMVREVVVFEIL